MSGEVVAVSSEEEEESESESGLWTWSSWKKAGKSVSVEPVALLMMTSVLMSHILFQNMLLENVCIVARGNTKEFCWDLARMNNGSFPEEEREIQKIMAETKIIRSVLDHSFPILYLLFVGPWSDHFGRKFILLLSVLGFFLQSVMYFLFGFWYGSVSPYVLNTVVTIPRFLTGGEVAYSMAAYSYIADMTTATQRTIRVGLLNSCFQLGVPIGFAVGGALSTSGLSYPLCFGFSSGIAAVALILLCFLMQNKGQAGCNNIQELGQDQTPETVEGAVEAGNRGRSGSGDITWRDAIHPKNSIWKVIKLPFIKREENKRLILCCLLLAFICTAAPIHGEFGVTYMFVRERLNWNGGDYSNFSALNTLIGVAGVFLSMGIFKKWLDLPDPVVGFIAGMSQMAGSIMYALAFSGLVMYLASTVDMMNGTMVVIAKSMMSKVVEASEIGQLFSLIGVVETMTPLAMDPLYSFIYRMTVDTFSGSFHFFSAGLTLLPQAVFLWLFLREFRFCGRKTTDRASISLQSNAYSSSAMSLSAKQSTPALECRSEQNLGKDNPTFCIDNGNLDDDNVEQPIVQ